MRSFQYIEPATPAFELVPFEQGHGLLIGEITRPILVVPINVYNIYYVSGDMLVDFEGLAQIISEQGKRLEAQISGLSDRMVDRFNALDQRLGEVERRLTAADNDQKKVREELRDLDKKTSRNFWVLFIAILVATIGVHIPAVEHVLGLIPK